LHAGAGDALDGVDGYVDADPPPSEPLRRFDCGGAAAEGVEDDIAGIGRCADDAVEQGDRLLRGLAEALFVIAG